MMNRSLAGEEISGRPARGAAGGGLPQVLGFQSWQWYPVFLVLATSSSASSWRKFSYFLGPCDWPEPTCLILGTPFPKVCSLVTWHRHRLWVLGKIAFGRLWYHTQQCQIAVGAFPPIPTSPHCPSLCPCKTLPMCPLFQETLHDPVMSRRI